jgi:hypothetical protein
MSVAEGIEELEPVHHRHHDVEEREARLRALLQQLERLHPIARHGYVNPRHFHLEQVDDGIANVRIILDDEHLGGHGRGAYASSRLQTSGRKRYSFPEADPRVACLNTPAHPSARGLRSSEESDPVDLPGLAAVRGEGLLERNEVGVISENTKRT